MKHKILLLDARDIRKIFTMKEAVKTTEKAFKDFASGRARMPVKVYLDLPEYNGDFRAMPAFMPSPPLAGVKWVNSHPDNAKRKLPSVMAMMIVNDAKTAAPLAVMDATHITSMRTGAAGAIAIKHLAKKNSKIVSVIGGGNQAFFQTLGAVQVLPGIKTIRYYDLSRKAMMEIKNKVSVIFKGEIILSSSAEECIRGSDIIITTTASRKPVVMNDWIERGLHINAIGADAPEKQELDPAILKRSKIIVDDHEQASHSGEINVPLQRGEIIADDIVSSLGNAIIKKNIRKSDDEITVFDSTGLAIQDIYAASFIIREAKKQKFGKTFDFYTG